MDKILKEYTISELAQFCNSHNCKDCPFNSHDENREHSCMRLSEIGVDEVVDV